MTYESFMQPVNRLAWTARTRSLLKPRLSLLLSKN